ncbi:coiled-coil domain-containing protein [Gaoshiqia sp. Z1-71]|uniref:coiled-coil domain-containing protein n=1 Tax=Gaoshiqia hydrogeniformans TaxID=3290090 RepID=UPI003BF876F1
MSANYEQLVDKLKTFKRKFYLYRLLKGLLSFLVWFLCYYSFLVLIEHFQYTPTFIRGLFFFLSLLFIVFLAVWFIFIPAGKLIGLFKPITYKQASELISKHFGEIEDKLINILELAEEKDSANALVWASIDRKIDQIKFFNFNLAVDFKKLKWTGLAFLMTLFSVFAFSVLFPGLYTEAGYRLIHFNQQFMKPGPFTFQLLNTDLQVRKGDSVEIKVKCAGRKVPAILYINIGENNFLMEGDEDLFRYQLDLVYNDLEFYFTDLTHVSEKYRLTVLPSPSVLNYSIDFVPPAYTGYQKETIHNTGDLTVPYGTTIHWNFKTLDTDSLAVWLDDEALYGGSEGGLFRVDYRAKRNMPYSVSLANRFFQSKDYLHFKIEVIPDLYPRIDVVQLADSLDFFRYYFKGAISDDYGFSDLFFNLYFNQKDSLISIPVLKNLNEQHFYFTFNFNELSGSSDQVSYYFTVKDNDYFHGFKGASSEVFQLSFPSGKEKLSADSQSFSDVQELMMQSFELSKELKRSVEELKFKSVGDISDWEKQQLIQEILNKKDQLERQLDQLKRTNSDMNRLMNSFSEDKSKIIKQQQEIEQLLDEIMTDELKALFDEFNKLAREFDQQKLDQLMNQSKFPLDDLSSQLERNLQLLKRMKIIQKLEQISGFLNELAEKELNNSYELNRKKDFQDILSRENDNFELLKSVKEEFQTLLELNKTLKKPMNLFVLDPEFEEIYRKYGEITDHLENKRNNRAKTSMEENAKMLENLAFLVRRMAENNQQQQQAENVFHLRQLLNNLLYLSLNQERIMTGSFGVSLSDPVIGRLRLMQEQLVGQSKVVKDSLYALAERTPAISSKVTGELMKMTFSMEKVNDELGEGRVSSAQRFQQNALTAANEMALFLNEVLENMERQMADGMPGDQECQNPGSGKSGMSQLKDTQESLKKQLEKMIEQMKSGSEGNLNESIGKSLAQHEMLQQMIREMVNGSEVGSSAKEQLKQVENLIEQNRRDLINKNVTSSMINRQNLILDRLLKAEKAEMEREMDDERESKTADDLFYSNPLEFFEYKQKDDNRMEEIRYDNYRLRYYYDQKYKKYINQLKN